MKKLTFKLFVALIVLASSNYLVSIRSQSFVSLKGRAVIDGSPAPNATVVAVNKTTNFQKSSTTDSQGYYKITGLPVGRYFVEVYSSGFAKTIKEISLQDYCRNCANANAPEPNKNINKNINTNSNVNTNEHGEFENTLDFEVSTSTTNREKGALSGYVVSLKDYKPVRRALITIGSEANVANKKTVTNAKGMYSIKNLTPGVYKIEIEAVGYQKLAMELVVEPGAATRHFTLEKK